MGRYLLVTKSKDVSPAQLQTMAHAFNLAQAAFAKGWGISMLAAFTMPEIHRAPQPGDVICNFVDVDEGDGTLAWHAERGGQRIIQIDVQAVLRYGGGVLDDKGGTNLSVSAAFQHECYEDAIDPYTDDFVQLPDGSWLAKEVSDPVESFSVWTDVPGHGKVHGSDAVLPAYFCGDEQGLPLSLSGGVREPFENDGYQITLPAGASKRSERELVIAHHLYTPNQLAYRKARIESGRGRGQARLR